MLMADASSPDPPTYVHQLTLACVPFHNCDTPFVLSYLAFFDVVLGSPDRPRIYHTAEAVLEFLTLWLPPPGYWEYTS